MSKKQKQPKAAKTKATKPKAADPDLVPLSRAMAKPAAAAKKSKAKKERGMSGLDAAAAVLKAKGEPMNCTAMVEQMLAKGLWKTNGKTPAATLYSAILREMQMKGSKARFKKTDRGLFALSAAAAK